MINNIESLKEKINNRNTKEYFEEVYCSFKDGNYRSAVIFLYAVVLYDLYAKLEELKTVHEDDHAKNILNKIQRIRSKDPLSSEWERQLIDCIAQETNIFELEEKNDIEYLKMKRNLCAHPNINIDSLELYKPNLNTVQALMYNMLQGVFIKPPYFAQKITTKLVKDLQERNQEYTYSEIKALVINRYLKHLDSKKKEQLFKEMWKFVFRLLNNDARENRRINFMALSILYKESKVDLNSFIYEHQNIFTVEKKLIKYLVRFLSKNPSVYENLDSTTHAEIETHVKTNKNSMIIAYFKEDSFKKHLEKIREFYKVHKNNMEDQDSRTIITKLKNHAKQHDCFDEYLTFIIDLYTDSTSYDQANLIFNALIIEFVEEFSCEKLLYLVEKTNSNTQCYFRKRGKRDHKIIESAIKKFKPEYNLPENLT